MSFFKKNADEKELRAVFILIKTRPGHEHEVYDKLEKIKEISELHPLFGEYDYIAKFYVKVNISDIELGSIVVNEIQNIEGVIKTKTLSRPEY